jgi:hypothetical protein
VLREGASQRARRNQRENEGKKISGAAFAKDSKSLKGGSLPEAARGSFFIREMERGSWRAMVKMLCCAVGYAVV